MPEALEICLKSSPKIRQKEKNNGGKLWQAMGTRMLIYQHLWQCMASVGKLKS